MRGGSGSNRRCCCRRRRREFGRVPISMPVKSRPQRSCGDGKSHDISPYGHVGHSLDILIVSLRSYSHRSLSKSETSKTAEAMFLVADGVLCIVGDRNLPL